LSVHQHISVARHFFCPHLSRHIFLSSLGIGPKYSKIRFFGLLTYLCADVICAKFCEDVIGAPFSLSSLVAPYFSVLTWPQILLVFLPGGMNSWFWYEFMVCSMEPILANIADNPNKIDYAMLPMMSESGTTVASI